MSNTYNLLEPNFTSSLGLEKLSFSTGQAGSLSASLGLLFTLGIMVVIVTGAGALVYAGWQRIQPSQKAVTESNKTAKRAVLGTFGVVCLYVLLRTFNADLVSVNIGLEKLRGDGVGTNMIAQVPGVALQGGQSASCSSSESVIQAAKSGNVCGNTTCRALSGCNYQQYMPIIQREASAQNVNPELVVAIMCRESTGIASRSRTEGDGTYSCGLMQVNSKTACDSLLMDPAKNIELGIKTIKEKMNLSSVKQSYPSVPQYTGALASYNCCSNGTIPHAPSNDCTVENGYPFTLPKWACPLNPGSGAFNMCAVKNYACDIQACVDELSGKNL